MEDIFLSSLSASCWDGNFSSDLCSYSLNDTSTFMASRRVGNSIRLSTECVSSCLTTEGTAASNRGGQSIHSMRFSFHGRCRRCVFREFYLTAFIANRCSVTRFILDSSFWQGNFSRRCSNSLTVSFEAISLNCFISSNTISSCYSCSYDCQ